MISSKKIAKSITLKNLSEKIVYNDINGFEYFLIIHYISMNNKKRKEKRN